MRDLTFGRDLPSKRNAVTRSYLTVLKVLHAFRFYDMRNERYASFVRDSVGRSFEAGQVVVDLGCGAGGITSLLRGVHQLIGVDSDRYYLLRFIEPAIPRVQARAEWLPFKNRSVGVIVAMSLVEHVADTASFFRELARVLEPGGQVVLQFPELRSLIEPHTKWPLLFMLNPSRQDRILAATGYAEVKMDTSRARVILNAEKAGFHVTQVVPLWHLRLARFFARPMGYFALLTKETS